MAQNQTPASERIHIGFFGRRNAGKSSVMNAVTGQDLAVVSEVKGTTTDPVYKTMELLPLGPVMMIDTPGIDDEGTLGELRVKKARQALNKTDIAVLVVDGTQGMGKEDKKMEELFKKKEIPYLIVFNKADLNEANSVEKIKNSAQKVENFAAKNLIAPDFASQNPVITDFIQETKKTESEKTAERLISKSGVGNYLWVSAADKTGITELKERLGTMVASGNDKDLLEGLVDPGDTVILVTPIDKAAPKGRLILPQQQTIRALLDRGCMSMVVRETELERALAIPGIRPRLVITDSQAFGKVSAMVPDDISLTSFSILFARYKGNLRQAVEGVSCLDKIRDGDRILISEGCTHHRQCGDIGTVKLPAWIRAYTKKEPEFSFTSGTEFPEDLSAYKMVIHCGGCMLNEREMRYRQACARDQGTPITNYGMVIAYTHGILKRSLEPFPDIRALLENGENS